MSSAMRLAWLPANQAHVFVMGDSVIGLEDEDRFFRRRKDAVAAARRHGLKVAEDGLVTLLEDAALEGANEVWDDAYQKCWKDSPEFRKGHVAGRRTVNRCTREATEALDREGMTVRDMDLGDLSQYIPSAKTLKDRFWQMLVHDQGHELAPRTLKVLRNLLVAWRDGRVRNDEMMEEANHLLRGYGIEYIESVNRRARAYYVNMGDTYNTTLVLDLARNRVWVTSWGDYVEAEERAGNRFE